MNRRSSAHTVTLALAFRALCANTLPRDPVGRGEAGGACSSGAVADDPWLTVQLEARAAVGEVAIDGLSGGLAGLSPFEVWVSGHAEGPSVATDAARCGAEHSSTAAGRVVVRCDGLVGEYVTLRLPGGARTIAIAELRVFALSPGGEMRLDVTSAAISSILPADGADDSAATAGEAAAARVDEPLASGVLACLDRSDETHCATRREDSPWLSVSVPPAASVGVGVVEVALRRDCCSELISPLEVRGHERTGEA